MSPREYDFYSYSGQEVREAVASKPLLCLRVALFIYSEYRTYEDLLLIRRPIYWNAVLGW